MNKKQLTGLCIIAILVLLAAPVFANVLLPYETAAVSRIVGDDPSEMIKQLKKMNVDLKTWPNPAERIDKVGFRSRQKMTPDVKGMVDKYADEVLEW